MNQATQTKPLDRRQKKTRQAIQNALLSLMKEKPLDRITVSELAAKADVNRKTFYNHYSNIQDVRKELDQQFIDLLFSFVKDDPSKESSSSPFPFIEQLVNAMVEQPYRTQLLFESGEHLYLTEQLKPLILPYLKLRAEQNHQRADYLPYALEYVVCGMTALFDTWIHAEQPLSPQELTKLVVALLQSSTSIMNLT